MNYLAHLLLAGECHEHRIGSVLADFTRLGNECLADAFGDAIAAGIVAHRRIDDFTDAHPAVCEGVGILAKRHRHAARVVVDILFDHFLLRHWERYHRRSSDSFIDDCHELLTDHCATDPRFPERFRTFSTRVVEYDVLRSYATLDGIGAVLERVSTRADCLASIAGARVDIEENYAALENSFVRFFPLVVDFAVVAHGGA
jgi:acyl carrier protein phosphodiesterase